MERICSVGSVAGVMCTLQKWVVVLAGKCSYLNSIIMTTTSHDICGIFKELPLYVSRDSKTHCDGTLSHRGNHIYTQPMY